MSEIAAVLGAIRCPACSERIDVQGSLVRCRSGHRFPGANGYLDLSSEADDVTARTLDAFGYEWNAFSAITPEDQEYWRWYFADVPLDDLAGGLALDAGCGKGRFTQFTAQHVSAILALDGSSAVESAARNLADLNNVVVVKADLRTPVLAAEAFDFVSCLGVLHHLPDPEDGFDRLVRVLRPGGRILIYVYSRPARFGIRSAALFAAAALRGVSTRLPHRLLRVLAAPIAAGLYGTVVLPGMFGERSHLERLKGLPLAVYRGKPLRALWLDTFDRLSTPLEARYRPEDVLTWFERAGLEVEALREDAGIFALGRRPIHTSSVPG
jgi:SAM-dependent methyltransferase